MKSIHISADNLGAVYSVPDEYADQLSKHAKNFLTWLNESKQAKRSHLTQPDSSTILCYNERDFADDLQRKCHQCSLIRDLDAEGIPLPPEYANIPSFNF